MADGMRIELLDGSIRDINSFASKVRLFFPPKAKQKVPLPFVAYYRPCCTIPISYRNFFRDWEQKLFPICPDFYNPPLRILWSDPNLWPCIPLFLQDSQIWTPLCLSFSYKKRQNPIPRPVRSQNPRNIHSWLPYHCA